MISARHSSRICLAKRCIIAPLDQLTDIVLKLLIQAAYGRSVTYFFLPQLDLDGGMKFHSFYCATAHKFVPMPTLAPLLSFTLILPLCSLYSGLYTLVSQLPCLLHKPLLFWCVMLATTCVSKTSARDANFLLPRNLANFLLLRSHSRCLRVRVLCISELGSRKYHLTLRG